MGVDFSRSHRAMDTEQHKVAYSAFIKLVIVTCLVTAATLVGMALFLT